MVTSDSLWRMRVKAWSLQGEARMEEDLEGCGTPEEVLQKVKSLGIGMKSVTAALANYVFRGNLLATCNGETLLHMAARISNVSVLLCVVQFYKKLGYLTAALGPAGEGTAEETTAPPLHIAVMHSHYENTVLLLKESREHSPESLTATNSGATLLHLAACRPEGVLIVKYLLREHRDVCEAMLLAGNSQGATPLQVATRAKFVAEHALANAESFSRTITARNSNTFHADRVREHQTEHPRRRLEQAKEMVSLLHEPTMQARAALAERQVNLEEEKKLQETEMRVAEELTALLQDQEKWEEILTSYVLSSCGDIQRISLKVLASAVSESEGSLILPLLTPELLAVLKKYIGLTEDDQILRNSLALLAEFSNQKQSSGILLSDTKVMLLVLNLLRSLQTDLQYLCVTVLVHISTHTTEDTSSLLDNWKQPLLLVKNFSVDSRVKRLAGDILERLGAGGEVPDPGSWSTADVCFWMEGNTGLERRSEFVRAFRDAEISGLHLLELSPTEMSGLGVKFVSDQRRLSSLIDDLRRLNMRSVVGKKDVFLSYAHINVAFAQRIKRVLNEGGYTVWIDTAGIRAGQKWRTEIAHGIHDCRLFVFIMSPRSTNSQYCHDELSLAEDYKKPIVTLKYQDSEEMDPGLKLIIQRRQWMDYSDDSRFAKSSAKLLEAVSTLIGPGSGAESEELQEKEQKKTAQSAVLEQPSTEGETEEGLSSEAVRELVAREVGRATAELVGTIQNLKAEVAHLTSRVTALENNY